MKSISFCLLALGLTVAIAGCAEKPSSVVEGATQSDVDKYNEMVADEFKAYEEGQKAAEEGGALP